MSRILEANDASFDLVEEYKGSADFYDRAKHYPDLNTIRMAMAFKRIVEEKYYHQNRIIIFDKGIFDSICWLHHFKASFVEMRLAFNMLHLASEIAESYKIVWLRIDPITSLRYHGDTEGSVVNYKTLNSLERSYDLCSQKVVKSSLVTEIDVENFPNEDLVPKLIYSKLKLLKRPKLIN